MGRIFFFFLLALAVYVGWRWWRAQRIRGPARRGGERQRIAESMVRCEVCGLNLPQSDALPGPGQDPTRWFCCDDHRRRAAADHPQR